MAARLDLSRWGDAPRGVGYRRWTIISTGLRQLLRIMDLEQHVPTLLEATDARLALDELRTRQRV